MDDMTFSAIADRASAFAPIMRRSQMSKTCYVSRKADRIGFTFQWVSLNPAATYASSK
jgi:hypothetical protein